MVAVVVPSPASLDALVATSLSAEGFLEDDDAAGGAERDLDGVGEFLNALQDAFACVRVVCD
jgi:hypothetical protein